MSAPFADFQLPAITIRGDARSVGIALGRHAAQFMRTVMHQRLTEEVLKWRGSAWVHGLRRAASRRFPDAYVELEGIAEGAGLPPEDVFLMNCIADLPLADPPADSGCTTFLVPRGSNDSSPAIIAHNEDACLTATTPWFFAHVERVGKPSFTSLCYAGKLPGTAMAVNSCGLVQTINDVRPLESHMGVPRGFLARTILDCADADSALETIRCTERASGYHHSIASAVDGKIFSVEAPSRAVVAVCVRQPHVHANHLIYPPLESIQQYVVGGSQFRQEFGETQLERVRADALGVTRAVDAAGVSLAQRPSAENDWHKTIATGVFELRADSVRWSVYSQEKREFFRGYVAVSS